MDKLVIALFLTILSIVTLFYLQPSITGFIFTPQTYSCAYNIGVTSDLRNTDTGDWIGTQNLFGVAFDPNNNLVYIAGSSIPYVNGFGVYNKSSNITENLNETDTGNWMSTTPLEDAVFDYNKNLTYLGGVSGGVFGVYNRTSNVTEDLRTTDPGDWWSTWGFSDLAFDPNNNLVYIGGANGRFGDYNRTSNVTENLMETDLGDWLGTDSLRGVTVDTNNNLTYIVGVPGIFGVYNRTSNVTTDLRDTDVGNWMSGVDIQAATFDPNNNLVYLVGGGGKFGVYNITSNVTEDLSSTDANNWIGNNFIYSADFDKNSNLTYMAIQSGRLGAYNRTSNVTEDLSTTDPGDWIGTNGINNLVFDKNSNVVYLVGALGLFGVYNSTNPDYPNWIISSTTNCTVQDEIIRMGTNGSIFISGNLTLKNTTILMNATSNGAAKIDVANGGRLIVLDNDSDKNTINDMSNISIQNGTANYLFWINSTASEFEIENSAIEHAGYDYFSPLARGVVLEINNSMIRNSTFKYNHMAFYVFKSNYNSFINNTFLFNTRETVFINQSNNTLIENNSFENTTSPGSGMGVYGILSNNTIMKFNLAKHNTYQGLRHDTSWNVSYINNTAINNSNQNIDSYQLYDSIIENNTVENGGSFSGIHNALSVNVTIRWNNITNQSKYGIFIGQEVAPTQNSTNIAVNYNTIKSSANKGIVFLNITNSSAIGNNINNTSNFEIHLINSTNIIVENNTLLFGSSGGILVDNSSSNLIKNNTIINHTNYGIWITTKSLFNNITNNTISNVSGNGYHIYLFGDNNFTFIENNTIFWEDNSRGEYGILLHTNTNNATVRYNTIRNIHDGISAWTTFSNITIAFNRVNGTAISHGGIRTTTGVISPCEAKFVSIFNNTIYNFSRPNDPGTTWANGINIDNCGVNYTIENNTILYTTNGIGSTANGTNITNSTIRYNTIKFANGTALNFLDESNNIITNNIVCYNKQAIKNTSLTNVIDNNTFCIESLGPLNNSATTLAVTNFYFNVTNPLFNTSCLLNVDGSNISALYDVSNNAQSQIPYTVSSLGTHYWWVYCNDSASTNSGNSSVLYFTINPVPPPPPIGGGGPGPPTGEEIVVVGQTFQLCVDPGQTIVLDVEADLPVRTITTGVSNNATPGCNVSVTIKDLNCDQLGFVPNKSMEHQGRSKTVYKCFDIEKQNLSDIYVLDTQIVFRVHKGWIKDYNINISDIELLRYHETVLQPLPTMVLESFTPTGLAIANVSNESDYIYFTARSKGFSAFVIVGQVALFPIIGVSLYACYLLGAPCWIVVVSGVLYYGYIHMERGGVKVTRIKLFRKRREEPLLPGKTMEERLTALRRKTSKKIR